MSIQVRSASALIATVVAASAGLAVAQQGQGVDQTDLASRITVPRPDRGEHPVRAAQAAPAVDARATEAFTWPENITVQDGDGNAVDLAARGIAAPITYQGRLRNAGLPANGDHDITIRVYDAAVGGTLLATTFSVAWPVTNGVFTFPVFDSGSFTGADRWLQIEINGNVLAPRQEVTPAPHSLKANSLQWPVIDTQAGLYFNLTSTAGDAAFFSNTDDGNICWLGSIFAGLEGLSEDEFGVYGESNNGVGVLGLHSSAAGTSAGVHGITYSEVTAANGVLGEVDTTTPGSLSAAVRGINHGSGFAGIGVSGEHFGSGFGVYGETVNGYAVVAANAQSSGTLFWGSQPGTTFDVGGETNGAGAVGLYVRETENTSRDSAAIYAEMASPGGNDNKGVWGVNTDADFYGIGVQGEGGYIGVSGLGYGAGTNIYYGVFGDASTGPGGGACYSIYGASPSGGGTLYAGYFNGNTHVTGTLSKAAGSFKIDHPLDPYNKYLYHSFVESPEMKNIYDGTVVLNAQGMARVEMPDYFESLNTEFRYQLTAIGAPMPNLYVAAEVQNGVFMIAGGAPGAKVSWQVTGVRQDAYANEHRIPVEQWKQGDEAGKLLHPTAFGRSEEEGIDRARELKHASKGDR